MFNNKFNNNAFTLAEVLIVIGIIGVVSALTLPVLIGNYKKQLVETKLKETYSIINQMMLNSVAENGESINWQYPKSGDNSYTDSYFFQKYLDKFDKITYKCKKTGFESDKESYLCRNPILMIILQLLLVQK